MVDTSEHIWVLRCNGKIIAAHAVTGPDVFGGARLLLNEATESEGVDLRAADRLQRKLYGNPTTRIHERPYMLALEYHPTPEGAE